MKSTQGSDKEQETPAPINISIVAGLYTGFRRPSFHRDSPRWFTLLVFGFFAALILGAIFLR